jgi:Fe-S cluster assembly iron-binding protein IscA
MNGPELQVTPAGNEVSRGFGVSRERVGQVENPALRKLKTAESDRQGLSNGFPRRGGGTMLIVTPSATQALKAVLDNSAALRGQCVRLTTVPDDKVGLILDVERQGDQVVRHGEKKVLVVDSNTAQQLDGVWLKYRMTRDYAGFTFLRKRERRP